MYVCIHSLRKYVHAYTAIHTHVHTYTHMHACICSRRYREPPEAVVEQVRRLIAEGKTNKAVINHYTLSEEGLSEFQVCVHPLIVHVYVNVLDKRILISSLRVPK